MGKRGVRFPRVEISWPLYIDDLVLCGDSEEDLRLMVRRFNELCRRRGLKVNASKSKVMVLNGEENWSVRLV